MTTSTKPFRRARDLFLVTIYLWCVSVWVAACTKVAQITHSEYVIDPIESPTLFRANRINYSRPSEIRQAEVLKELDALEAAHDAKMEKLEAAHQAELQEKAHKHDKLVEKWVWDFEEDVRAKQKLAEEAEAKDREAQRQKDLEEFTRKELERQKAYKEQREKEKALAASKPHLQDLREKEQRYYAATQQFEDWNGMGMHVSVHAAYSREFPNLQSRVLHTYKQLDIVNVNAYITGELLHGTSVWYRVRDGGFIWAGAFSVDARESLENLNQAPEFTQIRNMQGEVLRTVVSGPTRKIHNRPAIEAEIDRLRAEIKKNRAEFNSIDTGKDLTLDLVEKMNQIADKNERDKAKLVFQEDRLAQTPPNKHHYTSKAPTDANIGDLWFDTSDNNRLYKMNEVTGYWENVHQIHATKITADRINVDVLPTNQLSIGSTTMTTGSGVTFSNGGWTGLSPSDKPKVDALYERLEQLEKDVEAIPKSLNETALQIFEQKNKIERIKYNQYSNIDAEYLL